MAIRKNAPKGFVDIALEDFGSSRTAKLLDKLDAATPWDTLAKGRSRSSPNTRTRGQGELYDCQERWNGLVSKVRSKVEHPFAMLKHQLGYRKVRYRGLVRNSFDVCLMLMACNLKRGLWLGAKNLDPVPKKV